MEIEWHNERCNELETRREEPLGRPKKRWIREPNQNFRILGVDNPEESANDRKEWGGYVEQWWALMVYKKQKKKKNIYIDLIIC